MESWSFSEQDLILRWERPTPSAFDMQHFKMMEYSVDRNNVTLLEKTSSYDMYTPVPRMIDDPKVAFARNRKVTGNYSTLVIKFKLIRHVGYLLSYFFHTCLQLRYLSIS